MITFMSAGFIDGCAKGAVLDEALIPIPQPTMGVSERLEFACGV